MNKGCRGCTLMTVIVVAVCAYFHPTLAFGYEITDKFSIGGILAGAYQYQAVNNDEDRGRGAVPFQPEISFTPDEHNELYAKFGFAAGNGLKAVTRFNLAPWVADQEDDVKDINGRNRDYLLTVWYKYTFQFSEEQTLGLTGGIIDATDYLDENAYSNDEYTQFMNEALVNGPNVFLPSYDIGGALAWEISNFSVKGVVMNVGENDDGNSFHFYGAQLGYRLNIPLGEGNYRLVVGGTDEAFLNTAGTDKENRAVVLLSLDQELSEIVGLWLRIGTQDDSAAIDYQNLYSGGINIGGRLWGREDDNIGIGYAYLNDGNLDINSSQVAELYARFALNEYFALTPDVQYLRDKYKQGEVIEGFVFGIRLVAEF